jgi:hypothetical protein
MGAETAKPTRQADTLSTLRCVAKAGVEQLIGTRSPDHWEPVVFEGGRGDEV